jgi:dihydroxyacid dehydratase/phosphogluconate dehydratase
MVALGVLGADKCAARTGAHCYTPCTNRKPGAERMGCANVAHAFAAMPNDDKARVTGIDKFRVVAEKGPNIGIVTAYNDMLSAHAPLQHYPDLIKTEARRTGCHSPGGRRRARHV